MNKLLTERNLFEFNIPHMSDSFGEYDEINSLLEDIKRIAMYYGKNDEMDLVGFVEGTLGITIEEYNPCEEYYNSVNALFDRVGEYNSMMNNYSSLIVEVDMEYKELLKDICPGLNVFKISEKKNQSC